MATFEDMFYAEPEPREVSSLDEFFGPVDKSRVKVDRADDWQGSSRQPRSLLDREASQPIEVNPEYMNRQPQTDMPETVPAVADKTVRIMNTPPLTLLSDVAEAVRNKSDEQIRTDLQGAASKVTDLVMRDSLGQYLVPDDMLADKVAKTRSSITGERQAAREQDKQAYDYYNDEATIKERIARNNLRNIQESPKLAQNAVVFTDRLSNLFGLRDDSTVNRAVNQFVAEDKAENGRFSSTQLSDVAGNIARTATEFIAPGKVAGTVIKGANTAARLGRGALSFGLNEAMQMPREGETLSDRTWSVLKNSALGGLVGTVSKLPWPQRITVLSGSFGGTAYLEAYAQTGDHEAALDTAVESLVYLAGFEALGLAQGASRYLKNKFAGKDLARMTPQEVDKVFRDGVHESVQDVKNYRDIVAKYGADSPQAKQAREALRKYVYVEEPTSKAQPVQDGNTAIIRPDTTPAPAVPGQTPAEPTRPVMPMEKPVPATSGLAEMERRANEAIKQPSNTQGSENTGLNLIPDAKNMVESNNISPIEDIIPVPADGNNAINAVEQPTDQIPLEQTVTGAGISEPMESLKQIALALNPNSEVQIETAARSLADDVDQMVQSGQLPADQRDQYITDKLKEAGLQGIDPDTVDAAGKNYITGEKAVISLAAGADPTTAVHEAVETQIKSYFGDSDIEASPELANFRKAVENIGLPVYQNSKKALEWFSDFLTDYVFASQKMRSMVGDETVDPVWKAVQDWNAKTKGRGKLAKIFDQMRQWFRDTIHRARELRKTLYGQKSNVDVFWAEDVLKGKKATGKQELQVATEKSAKLSGKPDGGQVYDYNKIKSLIPADMNSVAAVTYLETGEAVVILPKTKQAFSFTDNTKMDSFIEQVIKDNGEYISEPTDINVGKPDYQLRKNLKSDVKKTDNVPVTQDKEATRNNISSENTAKAGTGELEKLRIIARKYDNANDFRKAFTGNGRILGESEQYEIDRIGRLKMLSDDADAEFHIPLNNFLKQYPHEVKTTNGLKDIKPNQKTIKIYRSATGGITPGDWVGLDKDYAEYHSRSDSHKIVSMEVLLSDLKWAGTSAEEWFYAPDSVIEQFKDFDPISFYEQSFNSSAGTGPGDPSYQLRSRPEAYAQELAALSGVKAEKLPKIPAKTVATGKLEGGYLVGESIKLTDKNRNSLIRQTEREIRKNRQYQEFLDQFKNAIPDMPQGLIQISKHDAGEYRQAVPAGYRKYFIYKENKGEKFAIPWDTILQRWHESDASISADMPVDDFMRLFTHYRQMLTASDKSIVDLVAYDAAKYEPEIGLLLERRKLLLDGKSKAEVNTGLMEYGKSRGMSESDVKGVFSGKGDLLVHSAKDKPIVRQLMRQLTDTQNKLLKERYGTAIKPKTTKQVIKETITPTQEKTVTPAEALRYAMQHEAKGSNEGWKAGQLEIKATQKEAQAFIQNNLPLSERGRLLSALKNATSPKKLEAVIKAVNQVNANYDRREAWKELVKIAKHVKPKFMRPEYQKTAEKIIAKINKDTIASEAAASLRQYAQIVEKEDGNVSSEFINVISDKLTQAGKVKLDQISAQIMRDMINALKHLDYANRTANKLINGQRLDNIKDAVDKIVSIDKPKLKYKNDAPDRSFVGEYFIEGTMLPELYCHRIDGDKEGAFTQYLYTELKNGERKMLQLIQSDMDYVQEEFKKLGLEYGSDELIRWSYDATKKADLIPTKLGNRSVNMSHIERVDLYASLLDPSTYKQFLAGGITLERLDNERPIKVTSDDLQAFIASLSDTEKKVANFLRKRMNTTHKASINETSLVEAGYEKATEEDYYSRVRSMKNVQTGKNEALLHYGKPTLEGMNILQERSGSNASVIVMDAISRFTAHSRRVATYAGMTTPIRNAKLLLGHPDLKHYLDNTEGVQSLPYWNRFLEDAMMIGQVEFSTNSRILEAILHNYARSVLGANPSTILKQYTGLSTAAIVTGEKIFVEFPKVQASLKEQKRIFELMDKYSPELRHRYEMGGTRLLNPMLGQDKSMLGNKSKLDWQAKGMEYTDRMVVSSIWKVYENKYKQRHPELSRDELYEKIARDTEMATRLTQNSTSILDMPQIGREGRKNIYKRTLSLFMSQGNKIVNLLYMLNRKLLTHGPSIKLARQYNWVAFSIIGGAAIGYAIALSRKPGRDDDKEVNHTAEISKRAMLEMVGNFYGARELTDILRTTMAEIDGKWAGSNYPNTPTGQVYQLLADVTKATYKAAAAGDDKLQSGPNKGESKREKELKKVAWSMAKVVSLTTGFTLQPAIWGEAIDKTIDQNTTKKPVKRRTY